MTSYDSWLEQPYQDKYAEEDAIDEIKERILDELEPNTLSKLCEGVGEDSLYRREEEIEEALKARDFESLGRLIWAANWEYWEDYAERSAVDEYNNQ